MTGREDSARRFRVATLLIAVLALASVPAIARADDPPRPNADTQPQQDGCQRSPAPFLTYAAGGPPQTAEWSYVYRDPTPRLAEGVAHVANPATGDLPHGHDWYDFNFNLDLDPGYGYLLGGEPDQNTGNFAPGSEDTGRLHLEWESGTLPPFAWPTEDDRVKAWGSWVWDCGHWGQGFEDPDYFIPGTGETPFSQEVRGEQTEFHPMRALVVTRAHPYRAKHTATEADAFISSDGTNARVEEECARKNPPIIPGIYGADYTACAESGDDRRQPVEDRDYTFRVPAPPRPSKNAKLRYTVVDRAGGRHPEERVRKRSDGIDVIVPFKGFGNGHDHLTYGKSFFVSWDRDPAPPTHLRVRFGKLTVNHSLDGPGYDPPSTGTPPGEWGLYVDANGYWKYLNDWAPGLDSVDDGQSFDLGHAVDVYVPPGAPVRILVHGRECDLPQIKPCPDIKEGADDNDGPGDALAEFDDADAAVGDHTLRPDSGNYELEYTVQRVDLRRDVDFTLTGETTIRRSASAMWSACVHCIRNFEASPRQWRRGCVVSMAVLAVASSSSSQACATERVLASRTVDLGRNGLRSACNLWSRQKSRRSQQSLGTSAFCMVLWEFRVRCVFRRT